MLSLAYFFSFFFFNAPATTEIYTLSLHDALPISAQSILMKQATADPVPVRRLRSDVPPPLSADGDRKSTRLNSSHPSISYAVFCLKKKKKKIKQQNN